jgi:chromosome segregation ATPase
MEPDMLKEVVPSTAVQIRGEMLLTALSERVKTSEADLVSAKALVSSKNAQITRLEMENVRLKMQRTDKELTLEVAGLRRAAGSRDKELVELNRKIKMLEDSEKLALRRASEAERKSETLRGTLEMMQKSRDRAQGECAMAEQRTQDAIAQGKEAEKRMREAQEQAKEAVKPFERLLVLADAVIKKSPSLNRNETEVKNYREARKV